MKIKIITGIIFSLLLTGCSSAEKQPDWLDDPAIKYPHGRYLSAVGEADNRDTAGGRALANVAKIFEVAIKDRSMDFSEAQVAISQTERTVTNSQSAARYVTTDAKHVLEGVKIVESWKAPEGKAYALAVLEKAPAERRFREGIRSADRNIEELVKYAGQQAPNPVVALAALEKARKTQHTRSNLNRNLSVVSGKGISAHYDEAKLEKLLRNALATLELSAVADSTELEQSLESALSEIGVVLDDSSAYQLNAIMDTEPVEKKQGWYWLRGSTELSLIHKGEVIAKKRWPLKVSATDKGMVDQRAKDHLSTKMPAYLYDLLTSAD